jgi:hypothetical protein
MGCKKRHGEECAPVKTEIKEKQRKRTLKREECTEKNRYQMLFTF